MKGIPQHIFSMAFFLPSFSSSLPGLEASQNTWCLASGPNEAQALMSHCKNSVRDTVIGKRWICFDSERSTLHRVWAITAGWIHMLMSERIFPIIGEPPTPLSFDSALELSGHLSLQIKDQGLVEFNLSSWTYFMLISVCYAFALCHSVRSCALPSSFLFHALFLSPIQTHNVVQSSGGTTRK